MEGSEARSCPSCGSGKLALTGRVADGTSIRAIICTVCKHTWPATVSPVGDRPQP